MGRGIMGKKKLKSECCEGYEKKQKFCQRCPVKAKLGKKERKALLAQYRR